FSPFEPYRAFRRRSNPTVLFVAVEPSRALLSMNHAFFIVKPYGVFSPSNEIPRNRYDPAVEHHNVLAILVGGGPAPGINSVIGAATIRARLEGLEVLGLRDGFEWIMQGDIEHVTPLTIDAVSRIHFR